VVGFDLFFWDAMRMQTGASFEKNTRRLFSEFEARKIPMIIAKVPVLELPFPAAQAILQNAKKVNILLTSLCAANTNCVLVDPLECYQEMSDTGKYFIDGLHLNDAGNHFCAEHFLKAGHLDRLKT